MKRQIVILLIVFLSLLLFIAPLKKKKLAIYPPLTNEEISGKTLWRRITVEEDYKSYPFWPDHQGVKPGQFPHGNFHKIYINPVLYDALPIRNRLAPVGSIIVKANMDEEKNIVIYTMMAKAKDYNPEHNDWFWAEFDKDGKVIVEGKPEDCIECHSAMKSNDYLIVHRLDREVKKE